MFEERQSAPAWVRVLLPGMLLIPAWGIWQQIVPGRPFGNNPISDRGLMILAAALKCSA